MSFRFRVVVIICLSLLAAGCSSEPTPTELSLEEASQLVIEQVIKPDELEADLIAFAWPEPLQPGDVVRPYNFFAEDPAPGVTTLEAETWFFWVDDLPGARFTHPNRFVFVDRATGEITTLDQDWWPLLNGEGLWLDKASYLNPDNWIYSTVELIEDESSYRRPTVGKLALASHLPPPAQSEESPGHALVINASTLDESGSGDFMDDGHQMMELLNEAGFKTTYMGPEGDPHPQRVGSPFSDSDKATEHPWERWLRERSTVIKPGETLFVYFAGHGAYESGYSGIGGEQQGLIWDFSLKSALEKFNPGVHIVVVAEGCASGGYADQLKDTADVTLTSTDTDSGSWGDLDFVLTFFHPTLVDLNPFDEGGEFTSSLVQGWKDLLSDPEEIARIQASADEQGLGFWTVFTAEAYKEGQTYDLPARLGLSSPIISFGSEKTKPKVVIQGATGDMKSCTTGEPITEGYSSGQDVASLSAEWTEQDNQHVLQFVAEFLSVDTLDQPINGGLEIYDPSRPVTDEPEEHIYTGLGNILFGFTAGEGVFTPSFSYVDMEGTWIVGSSEEFSGSVDGNQIIIDVPAYLVPPDGTYYFFTDDGSVCDDVGLGQVGLEGTTPPGGPVVSPPGYADEMDAVFNDFLADAHNCQSGEFVDDPGVDIQRVEFRFDPTVPGGWLIVDVLTGDSGPALLDNFSFTTLVNLTHGVEAQQTYLWDIHEGIMAGIRVDSETGVETDTTAQIDIREASVSGAPGTAVSFEIPFLELPPQVDGFQIFTYRTLAAGDSQHCDDVVILLQPAIIQDPE